MTLHYKLSVLYRESVARDWTDFIHLFLKKKSQNMKQVVLKRKNIEQYKSVKQTIALWSYQKRGKLEIVIHSLTDKKKKPYQNRPLKILFMPCYSRNTKYLSALPTFTPFPFVSNLSLKELSLLMNWKKIFRLSNKAQ